MINFEAPVVELELESQVMDSDKHPMLIGNPNQAWDSYSRDVLPIFVDDLRQETRIPQIGITMAYANEIYVCRQSYAQRVREAGGRPVFLPHVDVDAAGVYVQHLDGLILSGGGDIHPRHWGEEVSGAGDKNQTIDEYRDGFEINLMNEAMAREIPILGVCRGMQVINTVHGGTLWQESPMGGYHMRGNGGGYVEMTTNLHPVTALHDSRIGEIAEHKVEWVNSGHHMSVKRLGNGLRKTAIAYDGTVESIELEENEKFVVGVQWHPEAMHGNPLTRGLFAELVLAAGRN